LKNFASNVMLTWTQFLALLLEGELGTYTRITRRR
jgi:hypothetical protein